MTYYNNYCKLTLKTPSTREEILEANLGINAEVSFGQDGTEDYNYKSAIDVGIEEP